MKLTDTIEKPIYCKVCMKEMKLSPFRLLLEKEPYICDECLSQIVKKMEFREMFGIPTLFLSNYDGLLKSMLMNFKEFSDIELAPCFLFCFLPFIKMIYQGSLFLPLPSSKKRIEKRGFSHLEKMLKASDLEYLSVFEQMDDKEQKNASSTKRQSSKHIVLNDKAELLSGRKVVLFDDVLTSGATFHQSLAEIKKTNAKKISGLVLMDNFSHGKIGN